MTQFCVCVALSIFIMCINYVGGKMTILLCYVPQPENIMTLVLRKGTGMSHNFKRAPEAGSVGSLCSLNLQTFINSGGSISPLASVRELKVLN